MIAFGFISSLGGSRKHVPFDVTSDLLSMIKRFQGNDHFLKSSI